MTLHGVLVMCTAPMAPGIATYPELPEESPHLLHVQIVLA